VTTHQLNFSKQAVDDIEYHKKSDNKSYFKKLFLLLNEIVIHPFERTGKPETFKYNLI
jgi:toxin YoeB